MDSAGHSRFIQQEVENYDLRQHPFYLAWADGTLPEAKLREYVEQYGAFIDCIAAGWERVGDPKHAQIEREHSGLWRQFARELGIKEIRARHPQVVALVAATNVLFGQENTALGALYAFEFQQPHTAQSKLDGLGKHYPHLCTPRSLNYFKVHAGDYHEAELLARQIDNLPYVEQTQIFAGGKEMLDRQWKALLDIFANPAPQLAAAA